MASGEEESCYVTNTRYESPHKESRSNVFRLKAYRYRVYGKGGIIEAVRFIMR